MSCPTANHRRIPLILLACALLAPLPARGQVADSTVAVAGDQYDAGGFHRWLFGAGYRTLWITPFRAEVLDFATEAGGLTATGTGGGMQTRGLRMVGANGRPYTFRGLDKDPSEVLPPEYRDSSLREIVQDQTSSAFPTAPPIVDPLLDALGILHVETRLVVLPDSDVLGEYREDYAGLVGTFSEWPNDGPDDTPGFAGATEIVSTNELFEILDADMTQRIDVTGYLTARLLDVLIGDWDRHRGQWRWANLGPGEPAVWVPIPEDRDQAFARYDGLLIGAARANAPILTNFSAKWPWVLGATWNGRDMDRRFLPTLDAADWDSVVTSIQTRLTDTVIEDAVRRLPPEHYTLIGEEITADLKTRRDTLPGMAEAYYRLLAEFVDIRLSDSDERVDAAFDPEDGSVNLRVETAGGTTRLSRRFEHGVTKEVRIHTAGGENHVDISGSGKRNVTLRVIGDEGSTGVEVKDRASRVRLYDSGPTPTLTATGADIRRYPYAEDITEGKPGPRDWGLTRTWYAYPAYSSDFQLVLNFSYKWRKHGFRTFPWKIEHRIDVDYATVNRGRIEYQYRNRLEATERITTFHVMYSGLEVVNYAGLGNETPPPTDKEFFSVREPELLFTLKHTPFATGEYRFLALGVFARYTATENLADSTYIGINRPYGSGSFYSTGAFIEVDMDHRDDDEHPTRGTRTRLLASVVPQLLSVDQGVYSIVQGELTAFFKPGPLPVIALRGGGKKVWGNFPYRDAALLGGEHNLRGYRADRFAGTGSLYAGADLRFKLFSFNLVLPATFGGYLLGDVGRVFVDGESSGDWHTGYGGGIWIAPGEIANTFSAAVATSEEGRRFYFDIGFEF